MIRRRLVSTGLWRLQSARVGRRNGCASLALFGTAHKRKVGRCACEAVSAL